MVAKPGYKRTEVGIIPDDWELGQLGKLGTFRKGRGIKKDEVSDYGIPCVRYGEIYTDYNDYIREFRSFISPDVSKHSQRLTKGDLLFAGSGETKGEIGKCVAFLNDAEAYAGGDVIIFSPIGQDSKYLAYLMNYSTVVNQKARMGQGDAIVHISFGNLGRLIFPLPSPPEQRAIAAVLSDVDTLIAEFGQLIAKKRNLKQAAMQQLLTGKKRLPGFTGAWDLKKLGDIFSISAGGDLNKQCFSPIKDGEYCFPIYSNSLTSKGLYGFSKLYRYTENSITVTARGTIGIANARDHRFDAIGRVLVLKPICSLNCEFVSEYLNNEVLFSIESTGVPQLTAPQISKYEIAFPKVDEQNAIAAVLSDLDAEIDKLENKLAKTRLIKLGMMQELLTGKTRLV